MRNIFIMKNPVQSFYNVFKNLGQGLESQATEEEKCNRAAGIIFLMLKGSGVLAKIIEHSGHAIESIDAYEKVEFTGLMGANKFYGIWIDINIIPKKLDSTISSRIRYSVQPLRPKLYRFLPAKDEQQKTSQDLWQGVTVDEKKAVARTVEAYMRATRENTLRDMQANPERYEDSLERYRKQAQDELAMLDSVKKALETGNVKFEIDPDHASLKVSAK